MLKYKNSKEMPENSTVFGLSYPRRIFPRWCFLVAKIIIISLLSFISVAAGIFLIAAFYLLPQIPNLEKLTSGTSIAQTSIIYDRTGEHVLYEIHGEENRKVISHEEIPDSVRWATIAAEDANFMSHPGIDPKSILRALKTDIKSSEAEQGASTITQQLARNIFLTREKTLKRKVLEAVLALRIELAFSKAEILDMYLNAVPYGSNAYGIESASEIFFGKPARELTLDEAALIAALPNATTFYSPYGTHQTELIRRQNWILDRLAELGYVKMEEADAAEKSNTLTKISPFKQSIDSPHFVFYVKEQLEKIYGRDMVERGGLKIYTTLDWNMQKTAERIVSQQIATLGKKYQASNAALVTLNSKTGDILAMVGSKDYFDKSIDGQVNVSVSPRQPGSSFKPFAYAAAFELGYQPETMFFDVPTNFGPDGSGSDYEPHNYDGNFRGLVTMRQALAMSLNIPAVKTLYLGGVQNTLDLAHSMGITTLNEKNRYGLALVLGGGEVTLLDETSGYSVFANDGRHAPARSILKIFDSQGNQLDYPAQLISQVINSDIARKINSILSDNSARSGVFGTNNKLVIPGKTVAAKTGTTQEFHDAWTVGYTPEIATGVWVGNNDNSAMTPGADGSYVAAPIWNAYMSEVLKNYPTESFIDYDHTAGNRLIESGDRPKIIYIKKKSGKEISEKKMKKLNPEDVEVRIETPENTFGIGDFPLVAEFQNTTDPMILRWRESLKNSESFKDIGKDKSKQN